MPAALGVGDHLGPVDVSQDPGQGCLVLGQDLGEIDRNRMGAVGQRDERGIALHGLEDSNDVDSQQAVPAGRRQAGIQPLGQIPR